MPWPNFYLLQAPTNTALDNPEWLKTIISIAPLLTFLAAFSNLLLAGYIFRFTKRKNDNDRNIRWFQELIYTPNKDIIFSYFNNLFNLKDRIPQVANLTDDERIDLIDIVKAERSKILAAFVDLIKPIASSVHQQIFTQIDQLTDNLTKVIDNDELKLNNEKTYQREISNRISACRNKVYEALFNYKG